jgi:hypothetical protein
MEICVLFPVARIVSIMFVTRLVSALRGVWQDGPGYYVKVWHVSKIL